MAKMNHPNLPDVTITVPDGGVPQYEASGWVEAVTAFAESAAVAADAAAALGAALASVQAPAATTPVDDPAASGGSLTTPPEPTQP